MKPHRWRANRCHALPPAVLAGGVWVGGHVGRPPAFLAPHDTHLPLFRAGQVERPCEGQCLAERRKFARLLDAAAAQPVLSAPTLPPAVLEGRSGRRGTLGGHMPSLHHFLHSNWLASPRDRARPAPLQTAGTRSSWARFFGKSTCLVFFFCVFGRNHVPFESTISQPEC